MVTLVAADGGGADGAVCGPCPEAV
jgi:hypothetical protein